MNSLQPKTIYIDFDAAAQTDHAEFFFRLMFAVNDLASVNVLRRITDQFQDSENLSGFTYAGLDGYLVKTETGHLVEAAKGFVDMVRPSAKSPAGQHPVYPMISADPNLSKLFCDLESAVKANSQYEQLRKIRNTILFHYNYDRTDSVIALERVRKILRQKNASIVPCIVHDDQVGMFRFPIGDTILDAVWQTLNLIPPDANFDTSDPVQKAKNHRSELGRKFVEFAIALIVKWINDNKLARKSP